MKRVFWFLLLFFSFGFISNAKALTLNVHYDSQYVNDIIANTPISDINSTLIPFVNQNMSNYYVTLMPRYSTLNNVPSSIRINIYQKLDNKIPVIETYLRSGYSSSIRFSQVDSIDSTGKASGFNNFGYYFLFYNFSNVNTANSGSIEHLLDILSNFISNPTYESSSNNSPLISEIENVITNDESNWLDSAHYAREGLPYYFNFKPLISYSNNWHDYNANFRFYYDNKTYLYDFNSYFFTYSDFVNGDYLVPINKVSDFGNNTYGFYNNYLSVHDIGVGNDIYNVAVICEEDKPFDNGYCNLTTNDLLNYNSNINFFKKSALAFTQVFSTTESTGYLYDNKYYIYGFRILKPFVPSVAGVRLDTSSGIYEVPDSNIISVKKYDGGSYTDYAITFKIDNSNFTSSTNLNNILVLFGGTLESYYQPIPSTFNLGVYRSFKLQYFDNMPTSSDIESFMFDNDLSSIDSSGNQTGFFTDNTFNTFGFSAIITAPFRFLYALEDYESCTDINLPFPYSNTNLKLKCVRSSIPDSVSPLISILQVLLSGFIGYRICVGTFKIIKELLDPNNYDIEVVDL